jgi:hypothetical protein
MVLLAYRHGLPAAEVVDLGGLQNRIPAHPQDQERYSSNAPAEWCEMRELSRHQRESPSSPFVFISERGAPLSAR